MFRITGFTTQIESAQQVLQRVRPQKVRLYNYLSSTETLNGNDGLEMEFNFSQLRDIVHAATDNVLVLQSQTNL